MDNLDKVRLETEINVRYIIAVGEDVIKDNGHFNGHVS